MIKYIGSKRVLVPWIVETIQGLEGARTVLDLFSGTSRVGHALKRAGYVVTANDHNAYAAVLARCYVEADARRVRRDAERLVRELSRVRPRAGWFTETYCEKSRYFQPRNGARIEAIREAIRGKALDPVTEAVLLTALMEAADRVDSTVGLQMAYLKAWAPRAYNELELRVPDVLAGPGRALEADAVDVAHDGAWDVVYLDPPYNQHKYLGNYHVWETLVRWDEPEVYGVACKRIDCRTRRSAFNSRASIGAALTEIVRSVRARWIVVSFSDEGFLSRDEVTAVLGARGRVREAKRPHRRYVGAKIGIYNPAGEKVGRAGHLWNEERLFVVECETARPRRARRTRLQEGA